MNIADWKKKAAGKEAKTFLIILLGILGFAAWEMAAAEGEDEGRTADELIRDGDRAFVAGNWGDAAACYERFLKDFGSAAAPLMDRIHYALARCYIEKRNFPLALPIVQQAMESTAPARRNTSKYQNLLLWKGVAQLETGRPQDAADTFGDFLRFFAGNEGEKACEIILLRAAALIQAKRALEAAQWLQEKSGSFVSEDFRRRMYSLRFEALIATGDTAAALEQLGSRRLVSIRSQFLAMDLAQNLMRQGNPNLALRIVGALFSRDDILQWCRTEMENNQAGFASENPESSLMRRRKRSLLQDLAEFKKIPNWDDSLLLLRANAFLGLRRYREAALALEALKNPSIDEMIVALRCWLSAEDPQRCLDLVQKRNDRFVESAKFPLSQLLKGTAYLMLENFEAAIESFRSVRDGEFSDNARVQEIKALLLAQRDEDALRQTFQFSSSNALLQEEVLYLRGVALSNQEQYDACREALTELIQRFPKGERIPEAFFRRASAAHRKMDFLTAIIEFREFLRRFPGSKDEAEALLLLGDALLDQKKITEGFAAYRKIPCSSSGLHEIAIFRLGKGLKKLGKIEELKSEMEHFRNSHLESNRLVEAIREIGWIHREKGETRLALQLYWDILEKEGDHPNAVAVESIIRDLQKLHTNEEQLGTYQRRIGQIRSQAAKQGTLAFRMVWAESLLLKDSVEKARFILHSIQGGDFQRVSPLILCDFADSLWAVENADRATELYRSVLKWHPAAQERDRALAGLARTAHKTGALEKSLSYWKQLLQQIPESPFAPEATLAESLEIMKSPQNYSEAVSGFERVIRHDLATRSQKVEALYRLGEIQMNLHQPALAVPYFQRIYIAYGADKKWLAQAYLQSARAFEMLGDAQSMRRTYQEIIAREDLKDFPEWDEAKLKLSVHTTTP